VVKCKVRGEETVNTCRVMGTGQRIWRDAPAWEVAVRVGLLQWLAAAVVCIG
jgi:hypothetical protein